MKATEKWRAYYSDIGRIRMLGGNPALDMANTLHWRSGNLVDFVPDYAALVAWSVPAMLLTEEEKKNLLRQTEPQKAAAIHGQWLELRSALKHWLVDLQSKGKSPRHAKTLTNMIIDISQSATLEHLLNNASTPSPQLPLLRSAAAIWQLMQFPPQGKIRQCEADPCGGFFLDQSRSKPRRWCSMDGCGNREKAARHRKGEGEKPILVPFNLTSN
jgi:predicted RNA-binding Zn ribbon-like protein